jgi:FkbM family methyltransferase
LAYKFGSCTNIGIQIRKLYQPELFPKAAVLPLFESEFGAGNRSDVCAFGFEPNPRHTQELLNIQDAYRKLGYPVHIFTGTAVSDTNGQATFFLDDNPKRRDWGASLINHQWTRGKTRAVVNTTDFASFVLDNFSSEAKIVMKLDVEGAEFKILPNLVLSGALCRMSKVVIEWHDRLFRSGWMINKKLRLHSQHIAGMLRHMGATSKLCPVKFVSMDDESYGNMDTKKLSLPEVSVPGGVKRRR